MTALERAAQLKLEAVELLLAERDAIDAELSVLQGEITSPAIKRGRPRKVIVEPSPNESSQEVSA